MMESEYEESMFPFFLIPFDDLVIYDPVKSRLLESKQKWKNQRETRPRIKHHDWLILLLLLPSSTGSVAMLKYIVISSTTNVALCLLNLK